MWYRYCICWAGGTLSRDEDLQYSSVPSTRSSQYMLYLRKIIISFFMRAEFLWASVEDKTLFFLTSQEKVGTVYYLKNKF